MERDRVALGKVVAHLEDAELPQFPYEVAPRKRSDASDELQSTLLVLMVGCVVGGVPLEEPGECIAMKRGEAGVRTIVHAVGSHQLPRRERMHDILRACRSQTIYDGWLRRRRAHHHSPFVHE